MAVLIDLITPNYPSFNVSMGATFQQLACSYDLLFTDLTTISLPQFDYGEIYYKVADKVIARGTKGGTAIGSLCEAGVFEVTQGIIIRQPNSACPSHGIILYQEEQTFTANTLEWFPRLELTANDCCYVLNTPITLYPSVIELNNNVCQDTPEPNSGFYNEGGSTGFILGGFSFWNAEQEVLTYELFYYDMDDLLWVSDEQHTYVVVNNNPLSYPFTFTPNKLTKYKVVGTLYNCCTSVKSEVEFTICDNVTIQPSCQGIIDCTTCKVYHIDNYTNQEYTIVVKDLLLGKEIDTFVSEAGKRYKYHFTEDSVYSFEYEDSNGDLVVKVVPVMCDIDHCYISLLRSLLCKEKGDKPCCEDYLLEERLAQIQPLYQTYVKLIEPYIDINGRYNIINISNQLDEFMKIQKVRDLILSFCDICKRYCAECFSYSHSCL